MSQYTAPNLSVDAANGSTYAYRRFGKAGTVPVVFFQHFRGNLDNWDPASSTTSRLSARSSCSTRVA